MFIDLDISYLPFQREMVHTTLQLKTQSIFKGNFEVVLMERCRVFS